MTITSAVIGATGQESIVISTTAAMTIVATGNMTAEIAQRAIGTKTVAMIMTAGAIGLNGVSMLSGATVVIMNGMKEDTEGKIIVREFTDMPDAKP